MEAINRFSDTVFIEATIFCTRMFTIFFHLRKLLSLLLLLIIFIPFCNRKGSEEKREMNQNIWDIIDNPIILNRVFFPRRTTPTSMPDVYDYDIPVTGDISIGARFHFFNKSKPTILFFHGNGETVTDYDSLTRTYKEFGINMFLIDYRGYGWSGGSPSFKNLFADAILASHFFFRIIKEKEISGAPFIMGRSIGSAPVCELALKESDKWAGLIIESGFAEIKPLFQLFQIDTRNHETEISKRLSNLQKLKRINIPVLLIHGARDVLLPPSNAEDNFNAIPHEKKSLKIIKEAGHNDLLFYKNEYFTALGKFVSSKTKQ